MSDKKHNIYYDCRKNLGLSRDDASGLLKEISYDRLERIENNRANPDPYEVTVMAKKYKNSQLCNYYCTHDCAIGREYMPEIKIKNLSQIVLETLASLNSIDEKKNRLIEITVDGKIEGNELRDFIQIKNELDKISMAIDSLKLWVEQKKADGSIDEEEYKRIEKEM